MTSSESNAIVIIVGVSEYKFPREESWNLLGPKADVRNLRKISTETFRIPDNQIICFTTDSELPDREEPCQAALLRLFLDTLTELEEKNKELSLVVFWSGHGYIDRFGSRILLLSDANYSDLRHFEIENLLAYLSGQIFARFRKQYFFVNACAGPPGDTSTGQWSRFTFPATERTIGCHQYLYLSSSDQQQAVGNADGSDFMAGLCKHARETGDLTKFLDSKGLNEWMKGYYQSNQQGAIKLFLRDPGGSSIWWYRDKPKDFLIHYFKPLSGLVLLGLLFLFGLNLPFLFVRPGQNRGDGKVSYHDEQGTLEFFASRFLSESDPGKEFTNEYLVDKLVAGESIPCDNLFYSLPLKQFPGVGETGPMGELLLIGWRYRYHATHRQETGWCLIWGDSYWNWRMDARASIGTWDPKPLDRHGLPDDQDQMAKIKWELGSRNTEVTLALLNPPNGICFGGNEIVYSLKPSRWVSGGRIPVKIFPPFSWFDSNKFFFRPLTPGDYPAPPEQPGPPVSLSQAPRRADTSTPMPHSPTPRPGLPTPEPESPSPSPTPVQPPGPPDPGPTSGPTSPYPIVPPKPNRKPTPDPPPQPDPPPPPLPAPVEARLPIKLSVQSDPPLSEGQARSLEAKIREAGLVDGGDYDEWMSNQDTNELSRLHNNRRKVESAILEFYRAAGLAAPHIDWDHGGDPSNHDGSIRIRIAKASEQSATPVP